MTYSLIEERSFSPAILEAMGNITSLLMLAETIPVSELALKLEGFAAILKKEDREAVSAFSRWLNDYFAQVSGLPESALHSDLHLEEDPAMLEENLRIYFAQARAEGRDEGWDEGQKEGVATTRHIIAEQLKATGMKLEDIARITGLDVATLRG